MPNKLSMLEKVNHLVMYIALSTTVFTVQMLKVKSDRFLMCVALGVVFIVQYAMLYLILIDNWESLNNIYIFSSSSFMMFLFGVWCGGIMLWSRMNPRFWLDYGYRVNLPNDTPRENRIAAYNWCNDNIKWKRWRKLKNGDFIFANGKQAVYFKMIWMNAQRVKLYEF